MYLTVTQVSLILNVPKHTLYRLVREKKIPYRRGKGRRGKMLMFDRDKLLEWLRGNGGRIGRTIIAPKEMDFLSKCTESPTNIDMSRITREIKIIKSEIEKIPAARRRRDPTEQ